MRETVAAYMMTRTTGFLCFKEGIHLDDKELTMAERREMIMRITELVKNGIINRDDMGDIFRICLLACDREIARMKEE